jgi:hypothetical protein
LLAAEVLFGLASFARGPLTFDVGPSTGAYLDGFTDSEERPPVTFRWTGERASIDPPLAVAAGSGTLVIRFARFIDQPSRVRVYLSGRQAASFIARPGRFRTQRFPVTFSDGPVRIDFLTENPQRPRLGIALDWIRLEGGRWSMPHRVFGPRVLVVGLFVISLLLGFGVFGSLVTALVLACGQAFWFGLDPFGLAHVSGKTALLGLFFTGASGLVVGRRPGRRWIPLIFLLGYLLKGAGIFHPSYFYPDVRNHRRYVYAFAEAEGSIPERGLAAQLKVRTAYPRRIGGKVYALPYSPVFFIPFTWLPRDVQLVEDALKHVALAMGAAEVIVVYWLAGLLLGGRSGVAAALLAAFLPPMYSRLFLAMWPTVAGHLLDSLAITAAVFWAARPERLTRLAAFASLALSSALLYVSSLFNLSAFVASFSVAERRLAIRALALWAGAALTAILALYLSFTLIFFREIAPSLVSSSAESSSGSLLAGIGVVFQRLVLFYGYGYLGLALAGLALAYRQTEKPAFRMLSAYGMAFLLLSGLRVVSGGLFKDLKEILFVAPLIAISAGITLEAFFARGRSGRWAAILITAGLIAFWWGSYRGYLISYASLAGLD